MFRPPVQIAQNILQRFTAEGLMEGVTFSKIPTSVEGKFAGWGPAPRAPHNFNLFPCTIPHTEADLWDQQDLESDLSGPETGKYVRLLRRYLMTSGERDKLLFPFIVAADDTLLTRACRKAGQIVLLPAGAHVGLMRLQRSMVTAGIRAQLAPRPDVLDDPERAEAFAKAVRMARDVETYMVIRPLIRCLLERNASVLVPGMSTPVIPYMAGCAFDTLEFWQLGNMVQRRGARMDCTPLERWDPASYESGNSRSGAPLRMRTGNKMRALYRELDSIPIKEAKVKANAAGFHYFGPGTVPKSFLLHEWPEEGMPPVPPELLDMFRLVPLSEWLHNMPEGLSQHAMVAVCRKLKGKWDEFVSRLQTYNR